MKKLGLATLILLSIAAIAYAQQPVNTSTFSGLPPAGTITGNELVPLDQNGTTKRATTSQLTLGSMVLGVPSGGTGLSTVGPAGTVLTSNGTSLMYSSGGLGTSTPNEILFNNAGTSIGGYNLGDGLFVSGGNLSTVPPSETSNQQLLFNNGGNWGGLYVGTGLSIIGNSLINTGGGGVCGTNGSLQFNNGGVCGGYLVGAGLAVSGGALIATATGGGSTPAGSFPQLQYNGGTGSLAGLNTATLASYAAHNTIANGASYDPRDASLGSNPALCAGYNIFTSDGHTTTYNYTIPFTGSSSTDNTNFFVFEESSTGGGTATILATTDFSVTGVNAGSGTLTLNSAPANGTLILVVHDDANGIVNAAAAAVASGGYVTIPDKCTIYGSQAAGTVLPEGAQLIGQGFTPNYGFHGEGIKPILNVIAPTGFEPAAGFNVSSKNQQFFEGFEITANVPGQTGVAFQKVPVLIGTVGSGSAGGGQLPGITAQYVTFNYGRDGFGAAKGGTSAYIFATLRFNNFVANDTGIRGPISDPLILGNDFNSNGGFGTYGDSGGMVLEQQGAVGVAGAGVIADNRFEFNREGVVIEGASLSNFDGNQFDSNDACGLDLRSSWSFINITSGWFRANGLGPGGSYTGNTTAGRDAHICINGAGNGLHVSNVNFIDGWARGFVAPIGSSNANTPLYVLDVNTAGSGVDDIDFEGADAQFVSGNNGASITDYAIYRNGRPTNLKINQFGQGAQGNILTGKSQGQGRGLPQNSWSSYDVFGDAASTGSQFIPIAETYPFIIGANMNMGPTLYTVNDFSHFECDDVGSTTVTSIFSNYNPDRQNNPLVTWLPNLSDPTFGGSGGNAPHEASARACRLAGLTWMGIPRSYKVYGQSPGCVETGSGWSNSSIYGGGIAVTDSTNGDSLACTTTTTGRPIYLWYQVNGNNGGTATWQLDSTTTGAIYTNGLNNNNFTFPIDSTKFSVMGVRIPVNSSGSHTITTTLTSTTSSANTVTILGIGTPTEKALTGGGPTVYATGQPYEYGDAQSAWTAAYDTDIRTDAHQLQADGLDTVFADVRNSICCNTTTDLNPSGVTGYPLALSAQGHKNLADALGTVIQYQKNPAGYLDPKDYGASCNAQLLSGTYVSGNNTRGVNTVLNSNVIASYNAGGVDVPYKFQAGTASCSGGGGDVGKVISIGGRGTDVGPTTYIASVDPVANTATLGNGSWAAAATATGLYALISGCPSNPNDPSTAHDDTIPIQNASKAANVLQASGQANFSSVGGGKVFLPNNCSVHNLEMSTGTLLEGSEGTTTYSVTGEYNNPGSDVTRLYVQSNIYAEDPQIGINWGAANKTGFKDFTISSLSFPVLGFAGQTLSCIGSLNSSALQQESLMLDHVTATLCPVGIGSPFGLNQPVTFTASITDNGDGTSLMAVTTVSSSNFNTVYGNGSASDWLALGRTVSGPGVTSGSTITVSALQGGVGNYTLNKAMNVTSTVLTSPAVVPFMQANIRNSLVQTNGIGMNGSFSDTVLTNDWFTNNFLTNLYLGPPGSVGAGGMQITGGREETSSSANQGGMVLDGAVEFTADNFLCQQTAPCFTLKNAWRDVQITGGLYQGGGAANSAAQDKAVIQIGGSGSHLDVSGAKFSAWSPYGVTNYIMETTTGFSGNDIAIEGGDASTGYIGHQFVDILSPVGGRPSLYKQDMMLFPKMDTTQSALSTTSTGGVGIGTANAHAGTALDMLSNTTTVNDTIGLPHGTTANAPTSPQVGMFGLDDTTSTLKFYDQSRWNFLPSTTTIAPAAGYTLQSTTTGSDSAQWVAVTSASITLSATTSNQAFYPTLSSTTTNSTLSTVYSGGLSYNPSTNVLTSGSFAGTLPLSFLSAATTGNTINNAANAQAWNWNTLGGNTGLSLSGTTTQAGIALGVTLTGAANIGDAGYFSNTSTAGFAIFANGPLGVNSSYLTPNLTTANGVFGTTEPIHSLNSTTTTYTVLAADMTKTVIFNTTTGSVAVTLPQAGTAGFGQGAAFTALNLGAANVVITPTTSTFNGALSLTLTGCSTAPVCPWTYPISDGVNWEALVK